MRASRVALFLITSCGSPPPAPIAPRLAPVVTPTQPVPIVPISIVPIVPLAAEAHAVRCPAPGTATVTTPAFPRDFGTPRKPKIYDFTPTEIDASFGLTRETQPVPSYARDPELIRAAIIRETDRMDDCVRLAIGAGMPRLADRMGQPIIADLALAIDPFGVVAEVAVDAPTPLAACLRTSLLAVRVNQRTARATTASVSIAFRHLGSVKPLKTLPPQPPAVPVLARCMLTADPLPVDALPLEPLEVDFAPPAEEGRSRRRNCRRADADKSFIRAAMTTQLGTVRSCYLTALGRSPALAGTITTSFVVGAWGELGKIAVAGPGDEPLHRCIADALGLVVVGMRPEAPVVVTFPFSLTRTPPEPAAPAAQALARGDRDTAAASFAALARIAPTAVAGCAARAGIVRAFAPERWFDPRVMPAIESFAAFVAANDRVALAPCIAELDSILARVATYPVRDRSYDAIRWSRGAGLVEAIARTQRILALLPELAPSLLPFLGDGLTAVLQVDEARAAYLRFLALGSDRPAEVERVAEGYARAARMRDDGPPWDDCEVTSRY